MKTYSKNLSTATIVLIVLASFYTGVSVGEKKNSNKAEVLSLDNKDLGQPNGVDFAPFWKAWNILNEKFVPATTTDAVTDQEKVWGAIEGLANSLDDPYTQFLPPVENELFQSDVRGNFEGVGMEIGQRDGILTVISPIKGTPAYNAGILSGDKIIEIEDTPTYNLSTDESVSLIRGKKGTAVELTIIREGEEEPLKVSVVRDVINIPTINTEILPNKVFVIELYSFSANSPTLFRKALREFIESRTDKLIIDLRGNPGGYLEASIDMASWFLPPGKVVVREDFGDQQEETIYRSRGYNVFNDKLKLVILINGGSASASEILAGALQEHNIAKVVGERSFGKGSVQELINITSETSLKVTIARWVTPLGISISEDGVKPDIEVQNTKEDLAKGKDAQKEKAIEALLNWQ